MENKKNDMFAVMLNQPNATFEDMVMHGVTANNTGIKDRDYYKGLDSVKENQLFKNENGEFDEVRYNNFYDSVVSAYNTFSTGNFEKSVIDNLARDPFDWTQPFNSNIKDISAVITNVGGDFGRRAKSITGIGSIGNAVFSMREIAQDNEARDEDGNLLGWTPNRHGLFKSIFAPTMVLATYDEEGYHEENGQQVKHAKGQYKLDENGDPYYEKLGNRDSYGKEVLRFTDTITVDGTPLNKWDIWDSDGVDKSIGKTIAQTVAYVAPLLIPGMSTFWGTIGMIGGLTSVMPTLLKGVSGILGDHDSPYVGALTQAESWLQRWAPTKSDASKDRFMTFENLGEIIRSSATQLFSQRQVANLSRHLLNSGDLVRDSKIGQRLSLGYMALTSSTDTYSAFKEAGASDAVAGLGMLATMGALYELMNIDYFKDALFKGTWLDESEANNVIKNYSRENLTRLLEAETGTTIDKLTAATPEEAANLFTKVKNGVKEGWNKFLQSPLSGTPKDLTTVGDIGKKMATNFNIILNRSVNEGIEETMEEVAQDAIKALFKGCEALGINMTADDVDELSFGWNPKEALERYLTSFGGGFFGGMVFEGINQYENAIYKRPTIADFKDVNEQMLFLIMSGRGNEVKEKAKLFRDKGVLGDPNLSVNWHKQDNPDGSKKIVFDAASNGDSQNDFAYNLICHEVDRLTKITQDVGITSGAVQRYLTEFAGNIDKIGKLDSIESEAIKKLQLHTTFMDDLVELAGKIVDVQNQIDDLTASRGTTDAEQRAARDEEPSVELQHLQQLKTELIKQKEAFFNHENDKEYIQQALFIANSELQRTLINVISGNNGSERLDESYVTDLFEGDTGFSNYMWLRYHKKASELSKAETDFYKQEYTDFVSSNGNISDIQKVGKTLFKLFKTVNESMSPSLQAAEEALKDTKVNPYYNHRVQYGSKEYTQYLTAKNIVTESENKITQLQGKLDSLEPESEEYLQTAAEIEETKNIAENAKVIIEQYELLHDPVKDLFAETVSEEGYENFQGDIQTSMLEIRDAYDIINSTSTDEEKIEARAVIQNRFARVANAINNYLNKLNSEGIVSGPETDLILNRLFNFAAEVLDKTTYEWINPEHNDDNIIRLFTEDYTGNYPGLSGYLASYKELLKGALESGNIDEIVQTINKLKGTLAHDGFIDWAKNENGTQLEMSQEEIDSEVDRIVDELQKYLFGVNLVDLINQINAARKTTKTYGLVDILESMNISVGEEVRPVLEFLEEQKKSLLEQNELENFLLQPGAKNALTKISSLLNFAVVGIQAAYDGTNHAINLIPGTEGDIPLAEISENTKNRLLEDLEYLEGVVGTLLDIHAKNEYTRRGYAKKSEVHFHSRLIESLLNGTLDNKATWVGKFNDQFGVNLPEIWEECADVSAISYDSVTEANFLEFKKRYIKFWKRVREEILSGKKNEDGTRSPISVKEVGVGLGQMLDSSARLSNYGEINAGENQDEKKNTLTNLGTVVVLGALLNEDYEVFYKAFAEAQADEDYPYMPFMQQEVAVHISYEFGKADSESVFAGILETLKEQKVVLPDGVEDKEDKEQSWNSMQTLENAFWIQGGTGAGKTTATSFLTFKMLQKDAARKGKKMEVVVSAPTEKQLEPYAKLLGVSKESAILQSDLLKKIGGSIDGSIIYTGDKESNTEYFTDSGCNIKESIVPDGEMDTFKDPNSIKYIFVDEAQFLNSGSLELLDRWAKANGVKVFLYGDKNQNGGSYKESGKFIENNISDVICLSCPSLGESLRFANAAKERNYKSIKNCLDEIQEQVNDKFARKNGEISRIADEVITNRVNKGLPVTFQSYEEANVFVGEKIIEKGNIDKYINLFKKLSSDLHEGKPDVCIIVGNPDDKVKYADSGVEVLTAKEVQGREYDFVIIDKDFETDNKLIGLKDIYTLIGRSKIGSVVASDLKAFHIENDKDTSNKALTTATNSQESFDEYSEWKTPILDLVRPEEKSDDDGGSDDESGSGPEQSGEITTDEQGFSLINDDVPISTDSTLEVDSKDNGIEDKVDTTEKTKDFVEGVKNRRMKVIEHIRSSVDEPSAAFDWNEYVAWAERQDGLLANEGLPNTSSKKSRNKLSLTSSLKAVEGEQTQKKLTTLFRKFASAVTYNMTLKAHHVSSLQSLVSTQDRTLIETLCNNWNAEKRNGTHTYIAFADNEANKSIIYWKTELDGSAKLIPIAIVDGSISGTAKVKGSENIFEKAEEFWGIKGKPSESCLNIDSRETSVGTASRSRILSINKSDYAEGKVGNPGDNFATNGDKTRGWFMFNSGHAFSLVSDCEILQEEDFNEIFKVKADYDKKIVYGFNVEAASDEQFPEGFERDDLESYQTNLVMQARINDTVVPVMAINTHRYVDLETLYNIANIGRFAASQIPFGALTKTQQKLIGENSRQAAIRYVSKYLGEFSVASTDTHLVKANQDAIRSNKKKLNYDYKLLTEKASYALVGSFFSALHIIDENKSKDYSGYFYSEVLKALATPTYFADRSKIAYKNGLLVQIPAVKGFKHFYITIERDSDGKSYQTRIEPIKNSGNGIFNVIPNLGAESIKVKTTKIEDISFEDLLKSCIELVGSDSKISPEEIFEALAKGSLQIGFMQRQTRDNQVWLDRNDDYNTVTTILNCLPIDEDPDIIAEIQEVMKAGGEFKDGFTLNENRRITDTDEEARKSTKWAASRMTQGLSKSNLQSIEGRIWKLKSSSGRPLFDDSTPGIVHSFKYNAGTSDTSVDYTFDIKDDKTTWEGNTLKLEAKVDEAWLQTFTEEGEFKNKSNKVVKTAKVKSINFETGEIVLTVGMSDQVGHLKKLDDNSYPTPADLSNGAISNEFSYKQGETTYEVRGGKVYIGDSELKPLFKVGDNIHFASEDNNVIITTKDAQGLGVPFEVPTVQQIAVDLYRDTKGQFYTSNIKLGKLLDYSENFIIFENGKLEYNQVPEKYIPNEIKAKKAQETAEIESSQKPVKSFMEKPAYQVSKPAYIENSGEDYIFYGNSWKVNGAWLYNNSDYEGGDGKFTVIRLSKDGTITLSDGSTYKLYNTAETPISEAMVNASTEYLKSVLKKERLSSPAINAIIEAPGKIESKLSMLNEELHNMGWELRYDGNTGVLNLVSVNKLEFKAREYAKQNNISLSGPVIISGLQSEITILSGTDSKGEKVSIYVKNSSNQSFLLKVGPQYQEVLDLVNSLSKYSTPGNPIFALINNIFDKQAKEAADKFLTIDDNVSDEDYDMWTDTIAPMLKTLQEWDDNMRCEF